MIVWQGDGNLLNDHGWTQLCPINAVGVMGAGLAKVMRRSHPGLFERYYDVYAPISPAAWRVGVEARARILTHTTMPTGKVLLFCSKYHWRDPSPMELIDANLVTLARDWESLGIKQLSMPLPGTGLGGLPRHQVEELVRFHLETHPLPVKLYY